MSSAHTCLHRNICVSICVCMLLAHTCEMLSACAIVYVPCTCAYGLRACLCAWMFVSVFVYVPVCLYVYVSCVSVFTYMSVFPCMFVHAFVCACLCVCVLCLYVCLFLCDCVCLHTHKLLLRHSVCLCPRVHIAVVRVLGSSSPPAAWEPHTVPAMVLPSSFLTQTEACWTLGWK